MNWDWVTMGDDNVCADAFENSCDQRHGETLSFEEWALYGFPQAPNLLCTIFTKGGGSNCRCFLVPEGTFEDIDGGALDASEAIASGEARAEADWEKSKYDNAATWFNREAGGI